MHIMKWSSTLFSLHMRQVAPGVSRWLEFIYPTDEATMVFYKQHIIDSRSGGQQGCPLMAVRHAMVQRILLEAAGVVPVDSCTQPVAPMMDPPARLDLCPMFADDSIIAGEASEVLRTLSHWTGIMPSLGLKFSRLEAIPAAGESTNIDLQAFVDLGCTLNLSQTAVIMKVPIGPKEFCERVVSKRVSESLKAIKAIAELPKKHCALYLLKFQVGRMCYTQRTTPSSSCCEALREFDEGVQRAYEDTLGRDASRNEWDQLSAPMRHAGLGLRRTLDTADEAYFSSLMASRRIQHELGGITDSSLQVVRDRINSRLPDIPDQVAIPESLEEGISQQSLGLKLAKANALRASEAAMPLERARLNLYSAPGASRWLEAAPSKALDTELTSNEMSIAMWLLLGVDVYEESSICKCCGGVLDCKGSYALSCMAGGDVLLRHNDVRDIIYRFCQRARYKRNPS